MKTALKTLGRFLMAASAAILFTGCASYHVKPQASAVTIPRSTSPIPVTVGIIQVEQKVSGGFPDMTASVKQSLDNSGIFEAVYYPVRPSDKLDGTLSLRLSGRFRADGGLFPKAFITGFFLFLPAPIVTYTHQYQAECTLELMQGDKLLKTYTATSAASVTHKLLAPPDRIEAEGTEAALKLLGAQVAEKLISDRNFLEKTLSKVNSQ